MIEHHPFRKTEKALDLIFTMPSTSLLCREQFHEKFTQKTGGSLVTGKQKGTDIYINKGLFNLYKVEVHFQPYLPLPLATQIGMETSSPMNTPFSTVQSLAAGEDLKDRAYFRQANLALSSRLAWPLWQEYSAWELGGLVVFLGILLFGWKKSSTSNKTT